MKKINCSSLPPCEKTLAQHLSRAHYIGMTWRLAHTPEPTKDMHPLSYGWKDNGDGHYVPQWFVGAPLPDTLMGNEDSEVGHDIDEESGMVSESETDPDNADTDQSDDTIIIVDGEESQPDDQPWSDDSESDYEDD